MKFLLFVAVMALTTYLIRALPLILLKKPIKSRFLRSFLHYVPPACLTAMTVPAIFYATDNPVSGIAGLAVGGFLALKKGSLLLVSAATCGTVLALELVFRFLVP